MATIQEFIIERRADMHQQSATRGDFITAWQSLTTSEQNAIIRNIIGNPDDAGKSLKKMLRDHAFATATAEVQAAFSGTSIDIAVLESLWIS